MDKIVVNDEKNVSEWAEWLDNVQASYAKVEQLPKAKGGGTLITFDEESDCLETVRRLVVWGVEFWYSFSQGDAK